MPAVHPVLYLFPDTNVFLQCKPLEQTTWETFGNWERIEIVVTRPIQTEIDSLKGKGNGRQASKARKATTLLRRLLEVDSPFIELSTSPLVHLTVRLDLRTDSAAAETLNYEVRDDQLVGTALAFQKAHPDSVARLLTDDTGVMFSARAVGIEYINIPPEWPLPPEVDESAKREKALREQLAIYERSEPQFEIALSASVAGTNRTAQESTPPVVSNSKKAAHADASVIPFKATLTKYTPLTESEIDALVARLVERLPQATEYGSTEHQERAVDGGAVLEILQGRFKEVFTPASPERIDAYKAAYRGWAEKCKELLKTYHDSLNSQVKWPTLVATISNIGSRPADDALVCIEALGKPSLFRPATKQKEKDEQAVEAFQLPVPPLPPEGKWEKVRLSPAFDDIAKRFGDASSYVRSPEPIRIPSLHPPAPPDPNTVYWRDSPIGRPLRMFELTCAQWRHAIEPKNFLLYVICPLQPGTYKGQVKTTVHAANLTAPAKAQLPVELYVEQASCADLASELVETVKLPSSGFRLNLKAS